MELQKKLIKHIDCTKEFGPDEYFSFGDVKVVSTECGTYREAGNVPLSRFGYRFQIENLDKPHMAVVRYPDDKTRFMIINDGTCYDMSTGIQTGGPWPVSSEMKEIHNVFWARWKDCSIVFTNWSYDQPAAAESIDIYELEELPPLETSTPDLPYKTRSIGIQYEDPCGTQASEGALTFEQWLEHITTYMKHSGQKSLCYPLCWYHGPFFPSKTQPADSFGMVIAPDRKQYNLWTTEPADWPGVLLEKFDNEGLEFHGVLTLLRLGTLMEKMNVDVEAIKSGAETYNNMLWNDKVQSGTGDWTIVYNARNYENFLNVQDPVHVSTEMEYLYYETPAHKMGHCGPMFNPLHPTVQQTALSFIRETVEKYAKHKSFKGVNLSMWSSAFVWFGSLKTGYDDYTIKLFQRETGIEIPVNADDPNRFSKRYEYLTSEHKSEWIKWRTEKIRELMRQIRDVIVSVRDDLELCLDLWCEMTVPFVYGADEPKHQIFARDSSLQMFKEGGIDPALYCDETNIRLKYQMEGGGRDRCMTRFEDCKTESLHMFRDHDYLDSETLDAFGKLNNVGTLIFNAWHESWGENKWFRADGDDKQAEKLAFIYGQKAEYCRMNSIYPEDGFWWDSQLRICPAFTDERYFLEHYAHALAEFDSLCITRGGLFLDKAHGEKLRQFAKVFNKLPEKKFETVGAQTDPVAVRTLLLDGRQYVYMINREYYPVEVEIDFNARPEAIEDLDSGQKLNAQEKLIISLTGFELKAFIIEPEIKLEKFTASAPPEIVEDLKSRADQAIAAIDKINSVGKNVVGMDIMRSEIPQAVASGRLAWLRRALDSYVIDKCLEL